MTAERVTITIDGREVEVRKGELLIKAAEDNGTYIPRFCWHPRMRPVGMCRMCLVEVDMGRGPMLVPSCTTQVSDGIKVETANDVVKKAQEGVLEYLLLNHPLDCPVCDRGGECPLQDQTMAYGPGESRLVEEKRHFEKPIAISDLVHLDRERCILCARCTRFCEEVSGDPLLEFKDRGYGVQVNVFPDEPFASYFSGNTVQICPVGALTARPYRFRARPWDLKAVESTCTHCSAGDRISVQASQNEVLRFLGVDSDATNHGWLSDKCRFGYEHIHSPERLSHPLVRDESGELKEASWAQALELTAKRLRTIKERDGGHAIAALGGARGTNEDAYALSKFMRVAVGSNNLDCQLGDGLDPQFLAATVDRAVINDLDNAATILVWGADLKEEYPTLYLRVRGAAQGSDHSVVATNSDGHVEGLTSGATLIVVHPRRTGLDDRCDFKLSYRPGSGGEMLAAIKSGSHADVSAALNEGPVVALVGRSGLGEDPRLAEAVAAFVRTLPDAKIMPLARRSNVFGALDMGVAPTLLPGRASISGVGSANLAEEWGELPGTPGRDCLRILEGILGGEVKGLIIQGADPVRDVPAGDVGRRAIESAEFVVALDMFLTDSSSMADVVLPVEGFAEKDGTATNIEGRVQKVNQLVAGPGQTRPDWLVLQDLASFMGTDLGFGSAAEISKEIAHVAPAYEGVTWDVLDWDERDGVVVPRGDSGQPLQYVPVDTPGENVKADLVLHSARTMYDDGVLMRHSLSLRSLAPGAVAYMHPEDMSSMGVEDGAMVVVSTGATGSVTVPVRSDPSLVAGTVYVPFNQPGVEALGPGLEVSVNPS